MRFLTLLGLVLVFFVACVREDTHGTELDPIPCGLLFQERPAQKIRGVCRMAGSYDSGRQAVLIQKDYAVFVTDLSWVDTSGRTSFELEMTGYFTQDPDGFVSIDKVVSTADLSARNEIR